MIRSADELEAELRQIGATRYHILHPFHKLLHGGQLNRGQVQAWALNRYYYQSRIPAKDATLLARLPTAELRRAWRSRIEDHDGTGPGTGGFVRERSILEAIASSLTELFSPTIISERVSGMLRSYDFVTPETLAYFTPRLTQAPRDSDFALAYVKQHARTLEQQEAALAALRFKCDVLWSQLDALHFAYVEPAIIPPGAFVPAGQERLGKRA